MISGRSDYNFSPLHLTARNERNRTMKDQLATYFTSNALPMESYFNRNGLWRQLENFSSNLVKRKDRKLYISAGGIDSVNGDISSEHPLNKNYLNNTSDPINVPESLRKVMVILEPGQDLDDISVNTPIISVIFPNDKITQPDDPNLPQDLTKWYSSAYITDLNTIQQQTNLNFLSNLSLSEEEINQIKGKKYSGPIVCEDFSNLNSVLTSNLLATESSEELTEIKLVQNSSTKINPSQIRSIHQRMSQDSFL
ncbi:MAG: hypothetical protein RLZZ171_1580 [Cyanobacteriota bacterium]|jgi:DNA/RNA endonuclease G (NUC1)